MPTWTAGRGRLSARRLALTYLVTRDHPHPEELRQRLDGAFERRLSDALAQALSPRLGARDSSIWLIRRLDIEFAVNAEWDADRLARTMAAQLARAVSRALETGGDGVNVIRFVHPAEYLAQFLGDLAEGRAWAHWYYARFSGLRMLPRSTALRTALAAEPAVGLAALATLSAPRLAMVLDQLTAADRRRLLTGWALLGGTADEATCLEAVADTYRVLGEPPAAGREELLALQLYVGCYRARAALAGEELAAAADALARLARLAETAAPRFAAARHALATASPSALWTILGAEDGPRLAPLLGTHARWAERIMRDLGPRRRRSNGGNASAPGEPATTVHGGVFLLLPLLGALPLAEASTGWPHAGQTSAAALIRLLILAACLGPERAERVVEDSIVRGMAGVSPTLTQTDLRRWQAAVPRGQIARFAATLARWQREQAAVTNAYAVLVRVTARSGATAILIDCARGVWAAACPHRASRPYQAVRRLASRLAGEAAPDGLLCPDPALAALVRRVLPDAPILQPAGAESGERDDATVVATLARLDRVESDLAQVTLPPALGGPRALGVALAVAAQGVLRALAWRLPGFARASLPHLLANVLDVRATVEDERSRRVVRLGRAPLHLVLSMTGMTRTSFRLLWLDERPIAIYPDEDT